jgi:hypothetical protein
MDMMKILLGATVALLLAAVVLSWQRMRDDSANPAPEDLARVEQQIADLKVEQQRLATERELRALRANPAPIAPPSAAALPSKKEPAAEPDRIAELENRLADAEKRLIAGANQTAKLERDKEVARDEAGLLAQRDLESRDKELRRARQIAQALLIANVAEYVENPDVGSFAVIEIQRPENVQVGTVLDLRRNTGVLGKLQVGEITGSQAVANPIPGSFPGGRVEIQPGDELIIPPPF